MGVDPADAPAVQLSGLQQAQDLVVLGYDGLGQSGQEAQYLSPVVQAPASKFTYDKGMAQHLAV